MSKISLKKGVVLKSVGALVLTLTLLLSMSSVSSAVGKGAHGPDVFVIQGMLKSIGSYEGKITGHYNRATVRGVKYYQKKHGLAVTGNVDPQTFQSIMYAYSSQKFKGSGGGTGTGEGLGTGGGTGAGEGTGTDEGEDSGEEKDEDEGKAKEQPIQEPGKKPVKEEPNKQPENH